jgi:hypothetical protein
MFDQVVTARKSLEQAARSFDAGTLSGPDAVSTLEALGVVRRLVDGLIAKTAKRVDDTAAHTRRGDRSAAELCARLVGIGPGEARRAIDTATRLEALPTTDAAVRAGTLAAPAVEVITGAAGADPTVERELLAAARQGMVPLRDTAVAVRARREDETSRRARHCRARFHRLWTNHDGMVEGHYQVPPEEGAALKARLELETRRIFRAHRRTGDHEPMDAYAADALLHTVTGHTTTDTTAGNGTTGDGTTGEQPTGDELARNELVGNELSGPEPAGNEPSGTGNQSGKQRGKPGGAASGIAGVAVHVVIDHSALQRGSAAPGETCEIPGVGPVNVEWVRSLLGDAFVTAIIKRGKDITTVAHLGRHIPAEIRTALIVAGRECIVEGCTARAYLEIDHSQVDHAAGGPTAYWNLDWECSIHHKRKTQGWTLGPPDPITGKRKLHPPAA